MADAFIAYNATAMEIRQSPQSLLYVLYRQQISKGLKLFASEYSRTEKCLLIRLENYISSFLIFYQKCFIYI